MQIAIIINKNTGQEICSQYYDKDVNLDKSGFIIGNPLKIRYKDGSFFTHEKITDVQLIDIDLIKIETTNKIWTLQS
jgi:hypothetical protein